MCCAFYKLIILVLCFICNIHVFYVSIDFILPACELDSMRRSNVCNITATTTWTCSISIRLSSLSGNILEVQNISAVLNISSVRGVMMKNIKDFNLQKQFNLVCRELQVQFLCRIILYIWIWSALILYAL